jgi:hypothetical protein
MRVSAAGGSRVTLEGAIDEFVGEWLKTIEAFHGGRRPGRFGRDFHMLPGTSRPNNVVNTAGLRHLEKAAELLLERRQLQLKLRPTTARLAIVDALFAHLPKALKRGFFSETAIRDGALRALDRVPRADGLYVFPVVFAPKVKKADFGVGPVRIVPRGRFMTEQREVLSIGRISDPLRQRLARAWRQHIEAYDHVITVDLVGYEWDMGWVQAREVAEFLLNLIRMRFGFHATTDMRLGGGFVWERQQASLVIGNAGEPWISQSWGRNGSHATESWASQFDFALGGLRGLLTTLAALLAEGSHPKDPTLERVRYANRLIAEAYSEPHDPVRLVRLVSALETLAMLGDREKAHHLAWRCACAGGWEDTGRAVEIYDAIREAYRWRNAVVHGDAPDGRHVRRAFLGVESHLLEIVMGFLSLYARIRRESGPQSAAQLRRLVSAQVDLFFWHKA